MEYNRPCESAAFGLEYYSNLISKKANSEDRKECIIKQNSKVTYKNIIFDEAQYFHEVLEELKSSIKELEIINCVFAKDVFINKEFTYLSLKNCCFEGKFYINIKKTESLKKQKSF